MMTSTLRKVGLLTLALFALVQAGCLVAAAGAAAAGGAAAGYLYYNGLVYRDYHANLADSIAAVRTSLAELQLPPLKEKGDASTAFFETRSGDGHTVRIFLDLLPSPIPAEGSITRVGIRVGFTGDDGISARILDQISRHLVSPTPQTLAPPAPIPTPETTAPPLAAPGANPAQISPPSANITPTAGTEPRLRPIAASPSR